jgi:hypothetical protein
MSKNVKAYKDIKNKQTRKSKIERVEKIVIKMKKNEKVKIRF